MFTNIPYLKAFFKPVLLKDKSLAFAYAKTGENQIAISAIYHMEVGVFLDLYKRKIAGFFITFFFRVS
jgi:hypothetical protein